MSNEVLRNSPHDQQSGQEEKKRTISVLCLLRATSLTIALMSWGAVMLSTRQAVAAGTRHENRHCDVSPEKTQWKPIQILHASPTLSTADNDLYLYKTASQRITSEVISLVFLAVAPLTLSINKAMFNANRYALRHLEKCSYLQGICRKINGFINFRFIPYPIRCIRLLGVINSGLTQRYWTFFVNIRKTQCKSHDKWRGVIL